MIELILIGSFAGIVMGATGVGGGAIIIFCLSFFLEFPQKLAQGTTLFIVAAPISLLAAMNYYKHGFVDIKTGLIIMVSFLIFSVIGSKLAIHLPVGILKIFLGIMLLFMGIKIFISGWKGIS